MKCEQIKELLSPYMDNMTNSKENQDVEVHLSSCSACAAELKQLKDMCIMLTQLEAPQLPESFGEDLHHRLVKERPLSNWRFVEIKTPRKPGWLAAGVAALALLAGIYGSSFLPVSNMAALWQDRQATTNKTGNSVAVEDILQRIQPWGNDETKKTLPVEVADQNTPKQNDGLANPSAVQPNKAEAPLETETPGKEPVIPNYVVEPKMLETYKTQVAVVSINDSLETLLNIVETAGAQATVMSNVTDMQAMASKVTREVIITVSKKNAQNLLEQLGTLGSATSQPVEGKIELTERYSQIMNQITDIETQLAAAQTDGDSVVIDQLNGQLNKLNAQKEQLDHELSLVQIKLYLVEEITP